VKKSVKIEEEVLLRAKHYAVRKNKSYCLVIEDALTFFLNFKERMEYGKPKKHKNIQ